MGGAMSVYTLYFQDPNENTAGFIPVQNFSLSFFFFFLDCHLCAVDCLDIFPTILILFLSCSLMCAVDTAHQSTVLLWRKRGR